MTPRHLNGALCLERVGGGVMLQRGWEGPVQGKWLSLKLQAAGGALAEQEAGKEADRAGEGEPSRIPTEVPGTELKQGDPGTYYSA